MTSTDRQRISQPPPGERVESYDLVVLGGGPAGTVAAAEAARLGKRVALVERGKTSTGGTLISGTLPSKTLREAAAYLGGQRARHLDGVEVGLAKGTSVDSLLDRSGAIARSESARIRGSLEKLGVRYYQGIGKFEDAYTLGVDGDEPLKLRARFFLIATGSEPLRPRLVPFASNRVHDPDGILRLPEIPPSLVVLGAGAVGCEYACAFAALGTKVTLVDTRHEILPYLDREVVHQLLDAMGRRGIEFIPHMKWGAVHAFDDLVTVDLADGRTLDCDHLLYAAGRTGRSWGLGLERIGVMPDGRGYIPVDDAYRTEVPHILAAGEVIGPPSQAPAAMEQGRVAIQRAFGGSAEVRPIALLPVGVYTIPEVSGVGETEQTCQKKGLHYVVGRSFFSNNVRGMISGDVEGMTKLVVERDSRKLLGVHVSGERATELVHIGQTALVLGATVDVFANMVFNYPTLGETYRHAAEEAIAALGRG